MLGSLGEAEVPRDTGHKGPFSSGAFYCPRHNYPGVGEEGEGPWEGSLSCPWSPFLL